MSNLTKQNVQSMIATIDCNLATAEKHFTDAISKQGVTGALKSYGHQVMALQTIRGHMNELLNYISDPMLVLVWMSGFQAYINALRSTYGEKFVKTILTGGIEDFAPVDVKTPTISADVSKPAVKS